MFCLLLFFFFFSSRRRHTRSLRDWSSDVCSSDLSMRDITQRILRSQVPVAVFVSPPGSRAGSAGVFIAYSAHIAAMAPSTNIGSAHPVALGGGQQDTAPTPSVMDEKVINDAVALIRSLAEMHG